MTITIEISEDHERILCVEAGRRGVPVESFACEMLTRGLNDWLQYHREGLGRPMSFEEALTASTSENAEILKRLA